MGSRVTDGLAGREAGDGPGRVQDEKRPGGRRPLGHGGDFGER